MAKYRQIHVKIWKDDWFLELEPLHKLFYIYLFSNERASIAGIYELSARVMSFESGLLPAEITNAFEVFSRAGKAWYQDGIVLIPNLRKYHETRSKKIQDAIIADLKELKDGYLKDKYCEIYGIDRVSIGYLSQEDTLSIGSISSSSSSSSSFEGGLGETITALCNVCVNAGATDRATFELANELQEQGRDAAWITAFGEWWSTLDNGRPFLKHLRTFGGHYDKGETPYFAEKKNGAGDIDSFLAFVVEAQRRGLKYDQFLADVKASGYEPQWKALGMKWSDVRRLTERQTADLRFRLLGVAT